MPELIWLNSIMGKLQKPDTRNLSWNINKNNIMAHVRCEYFDPRGKVNPGHIIIDVDWLPLWWTDPHVEIKNNQHIEIVMIIMVLTIADARYWTHFRLVYAKACHNSKSG